MGWGGWGRAQRFFSIFKALLWYNIIVMKNKLIKKILEYTVIFEPAEKGGYVVSVPSLPGCVTNGETFEEATAMVKDAMEGYLAVLKEEGLEIPEENSEVVIAKVAVANPAISLL